MNPSTRIQAIVEEYLRLRAGEFGIWIQLDNEVNDDNHLVIHRPEEGNWVTLQAYASNRSIHLLYPTHEGAPPYQIDLWKIQNSRTYRQISVVGHQQKNSTQTDCLSENK